MILYFIFLSLIMHNTYGAESTPKKIRTENQTNLVNNQERYVVSLKDQMVCSIAINIAWDLRDIRYNPQRIEKHNDNSTNKSNSVRIQESRFKELAHLSKNFQILPYTLQEEIYELASKIFNSLPCYHSTLSTKKEALETISSNMRRYFIFLDMKRHSLNNKTLSKLSDSSHTLSRAQLYYLHQQPHYAKLHYPYTKQQEVVDNVLVNEEFNCIANPLKTILANNCIAVILKQEYLNGEWLKNRYVEHNKINYSDEDKKQMYTNDVICIEEKFAILEQINSFFEHSASKDSKEIKAALQKILNPSNPPHSERLQQKVELLFGSSTYKDLKQ